MGIHERIACRLTFKAMRFSQTMEDAVNYALEQYTLLQTQNRSSDTAGGALDETTTDSAVTTRHSNQEQVRYSRPVTTREFYAYKWPNKEITVRVHVRQGQEAAEARINHTTFIDKGKI
jgi:hypothetical protein